MRQQAGTIGPGAYVIAVVRKCLIDETYGGFGEGESVVIGKALARNFLHQTVNGEAFRGRFDQGIAQQRGDGIVEGNIVRNFVPSAQDVTWNAFGGEEGA